MNITLTTVVVAILTAVGGGLLASIVNGVFTRSKVSAEAESTRATAVQIATNTTLSIIKDLRDEVSRLSRRLAEAERESEDAKNRAEQADSRAVRAEYDMMQLRRGMAAYRRRVEYLTQLLEKSGINVLSWTPPEEIDGEESSGA